MPKMSKISSRSTYDAKYFETSAKTGTNVKELFYDIA